LDKVPDVGVPRTGVTRVGDVAKTRDPDPVSSVTAAAKFADEGVPNHVATPEPREVIPVPPLPAGNVPVTFVVRFTKVVEVLPVPPLAIGRVPVTFVVRLTKVVEVLPVPPLAIGSVPVTFVVRLTKVVEVLPVPPEAIGRADPSVSEVRCVTASTTLVPLL
jgi:hypothetical protein